MNVASRVRQFNSKFIENTSCNIVYIAGTKTIIVEPHNYQRRFVFGTICGCVCVGGGGDIYILFFLVFCQTDFF